MRKLILISALCLASAAAHAGQSLRGLSVAAADIPAAASTESLPQPLPPVSKKDSDKDTTRETAKETAKDTPKPQASETTSRPHTSRPRPEARRHESDEAKARRIAAQYGIRW